MEKIKDKEISDVFLETAEFKSDVIINISTRQVYFKKCKNYQ